jgi:hypothetical protein
MSLIKNRKVAFEISCLSEGRWTIDCVVHDEEEAVNYGRTLLRAGECEEIRIVRHRTGPTGFTVETEILREVAPRDKKASVALAGDPDQVPVCQHSEALYGIDARLAVGKLMRRYLEQEGITATELMHVWPYMRRLDDKAGQLVAAAMYRVSESQAKILGIGPKERLATLQRWIAKAMERVREFDFVRRKVPFDLADLEHSMRRLDAAIGDGQRQFGLTAQLSYQLLGTGSLAGRLEKLLEMAEGAKEAHLFETLDGMIADALSFPSIVNDMLAALPNRAAGITRLADVVTGRFAPGPGERVDPVFSRFVKLQGERPLPISSVIMLDWLIREVGRDKPLDRHNPDGDDALLQKLLPRLRDDKGALLGGVRMQEAIGAFRLGQRQRVLRGMGMHDQANELAKVWSLDMVERMAPLVET